uniref:Uncharacterized protein n=1 Tax=Desertifilum tharense IPPAS B-1220 TaxID=1781255 RepID=A0ACD5GV64_9CYAN
MKTVACQDDLRILGKTLQERLHAELSDEIRFQVQCALKPNLLMVLAQHRASQQPNPQEVFRVLQQGVERERYGFLRSSTAIFARCRTAKTLRLSQVYADASG